MSSRILKRRNNNSAEGMGCLLLLLGLVWLYTALFGDYTDKDFMDSRYLPRAESSAVDFVLDWQKRNWRPRGFTDEYQVIRSEPGFEVHWERQKDSVDQRVEYVGGGVFEVIVETDTLLTSKFGDEVTIHEAFALKILTPYEHGFLYRKICGDDWKLLEAYEIFKEPSLQEINEIVKMWSEKGAS